jgi:hypothetical protein
VTTPPYGDGEVRAQSAWQLICIFVQLSRQAML